MQNHYQETLKKAATLSDIYIMREEFQQKANEYEKEYHSGGVKVYSETLKKLTEAKYDESHMLPIGLIPKFINKLERLDEVRGALSRYFTAGLPIPIEWIEEYNELVEETKIKTP